MKKKSILLVTIAVAGVIFSLTGIAYFRHKRMPMRPVDKFNAVWSTLQKHYYDNTFNGYDWVAVGARLRKRVPARDPEDFITNEIFSDMFSLLEVSHLGYIPNMAAQHGSGAERQAAMAVPRLETIAGLIISSPTYPIKPILLHLDADSFLYRQGVKPGLPVDIGVTKQQRTSGSSIGTAGDTAEMFYWVTMPDGSTRELTTKAPIGDSNRPLPYIDYSKRQIIVDRIDPPSFEKLHQLLLEPAASQFPIVYLPCGIVSSHGRAGKLVSVVDVVKDSPADLAGIEPGSLLEELHASSSSGVTFAHIKARLPDGEEKNLSAPYFYASPRAGSDENEETAVAYGPVLVLRFNEFNSESATWLASQLRTKRPNEVVLDLRYNGGGAVTALKQILAQFLPAEALIATTQNASGQTDVRVPTGTAPSAAKLAVLIGPGSASAAEVTAAALQHYGRAKLIGMTTAGEVLVSNLFRYEDGSSLEVPVAALRDAAGRTLEGQGVTPDLMMKRNTLADIRQGRDVTMECAVALLAKGECK